MKKLLPFFFFCGFFALPVAAQTLVQSVTHSLNDPTTVHAATLSKPVSTTDFLTVFMRNCNFAGATTAPFVDSQGNTWKAVDEYGNKWYVESAKGGPLTLTFNYTNPTYCQFAISEFKGSYALDVVSKPDYLEDVTAGTSFLITPSSNGELIIGFGSADCHCPLGYDPAISAGAGFTLAALTPPLYVEYQIQAAAAPIAATDNHAAPVDTIITVAAFKPLNVPFVFKLVGCCTITFPMTTPPSCSAADGKCSITIQVCDTATPPNCLLSNVGTLSLVKTSELPVPQVLTVPVAIATNP